MKQATIADLQVAHDKARALMQSMVPYDGTIDAETLDNIRALVATIFSTLEVNNALTSDQVTLSLGLFRTAYLLGWRDGQAERTAARLLDS